MSTRSFHINGEDRDSAVRFVNLEQDRNAVVCLSMLVTFDASSDQSRVAAQKWSPATKCVNCEFTIERREGRGEPFLKETKVSGRKQRCQGDKGVRNQYRKETKVSGTNIEETKGGNKGVREETKVSGTNIGHAHTTQAAIIARTVPDTFDSPAALDACDVPYRTTTLGPPLEEVSNSIRSSLS